MEYLIRPCEIKDLSALVRLCQNHAEYEQAAYYNAGKEELLGTALFAEDPKLFCMVIESNNQLAGYFSYTFDFSTWDAQNFLYLDCLYLEPAYRGFGIGEQAIEILKVVGKENKCVNIQWQTPIFNERGIKFYKRIGGNGNEKMRFSIDLPLPYEDNLQQRR